jgi:flagella basal body P-ring formation protein FlgA
MELRLAVLTLLFLCLTISDFTEASTTLTHENLTRVLRRYVVENGPWKEDSVEVRHVSYVPTSAIPITAKLRVLRPIGGSRPGLQSFLVLVKTEGKEDKKVWVKADVRVFDDVVVSSQPLMMHEIVTAKQVHLDRRDISNLNGRTFSRLDDVIGQQVTRALAVNETLTHRALTRPAIIRRGVPVMLVYETAGLRVELPGIAEENGRAGELVQVRNPSSGKLLRGRVLDQRSVGMN